MTTATFEEFLVQMDGQMEAENREILLFIDQCFAHPTDTTALKNISYIFLSKLQKPFATTGFGDHPCFQMPV
jgi:hypothetical protein